MELLFTMLVPFLMLAVALWGLVKRVDLWGALTDGAEKGLKVSLRIMPPLIGLLTAVYMLRASGALELLAEGKAGEGLAAWQALGRLICENEPDIQPYLDVYRVLDVTENYTGFRSHCRLREPSHLPHEFKSI